jgi:hypothetical protein
MKKKKQIIDLENQRYGMFMNQNSFDLDVYYGRNFIETDNNQYVLLHRIDLIETTPHSLYGQTKPKDKKYKKAVKLAVMITVDDGQQSYYGEGKGGIVRDDSGNIKFGIYLKELEEKNVEITRGDIVEYNMSGEKGRFYEIQSANNVSDATSKTIGGFAPYYKMIVGVPVHEDVTPFLSETKGEK